MSERHFQPATLRAKRPTAALAAAPEWLPAYDKCAAAEAAEYRRLLDAATAECFRQALAAFGLPPEVMP